MRNIAVFCGAKEGYGEAYKSDAYLFGRLLAQADIRLIYGGSDVGLMGAVARGTLEHGGRAVGVVPYLLTKKETVCKGLTETIICSTMHERKAIMSYMSDGYVALPGGFGTFDEVFEQICWHQIGLHRKPVGFLNTDGYYDYLALFLKESVYKDSFITAEHYQIPYFAVTPYDLLQHLTSAPVVDDTPVTLPIK